MRVGKGLLWLLCLLLIAGCEKDFIIDQQSASNKMVINSLINDHYAMQVYVTKSFPIGATNNNMTAIPDAHIELYEDNVFKEVLHYVPSDTQAAFGSYLSYLIPAAGKTYTIKASDGKYLDASATDAIPRPAQLVSYAYQSYDDTGAVNGCTMNMVFKDDPAVQNYYRINVWINGWQRTIADNGDTVNVFQNYAIEPWQQSPLTDTVRDGYFLLFSDQGFNGLQKTLSLSFNSIDARSFNSLNVYVELHTVSAAHFKYFKTLNAYRNNQYSSEPTYIYNNITNGLGDFVGETWQSITYAVK